MSGKAQTAGVDTVRVAFGPSVRTPEVEAA
jgi:hypothetical protein